MFLIQICQKDIEEKCASQINKDADANPKPRDFINKLATVTLKAFVEIDSYVSYNQYRLNPYWN
jgi:hypothetical protein